MSPKHDNPTQPRWDEKQQREQWARAPYNFVPLPDQAVKAQLPPDQDIYEGYTGRIDCELETCSPTYVRGMLTETQYAVYGNTPPDQLTEEQKLEHAPFFSSSQELVEGRPKPVIPGGSLRGMLRTLTEIAGYGKIRWVTREDRVFFRAVAAPKSDPLSAPYKNVLKNVRAGYLVKKGEDWFIQPAQGGKENYLKVREKDVLESPVKFIPMDSPDYRPQYVEVCFTTKQTPKGRLVVDQIGPRDKSPKSWKRGVMVCSGNMRESNRETGDTQRCNHWVIPEPDPKMRVRSVRTDYAACGARA